MKNFILPIILLSSMVFSNCTVDGSSFNNFTSKSITASSTQVSETRKLSTFEGIEASNAIDIVIVDDTYNGEITITAPDNVMKEVKSVVENKVLKLYLEKSIRFNSKKVEVRIPHRKLRYVSLSGACSLKASHMMKIEEFKLDISGASKFEMNLMTNKINVDLSGASDAIINGNAQTMYADISGASSLKATDLKVASATVEASGASSAKLWVVDELNADASGASSIKYKNASNIKLVKKSSGASSVASF